jgi:oxalate decarboxylase
MRLSTGGVRELHWHQAAEWAYMTYGVCRITVIDPVGRPYVADVKEGDIWYFPAGYPHPLQGLGPDGWEFVICFDDGAAGEFNTLLVTDWFAHTPPSVLAKNFGVSAETFANIPPHNSLATAKNSLRSDNRYCWVLHFKGKTIDAVRAYLDSTMVTRLFEENPI